MTPEKQQSSPDEEECAGYQRPPHTATIVISRQYPNGTRDGLCRACADAWLVSEENWPPPKSAIPN